MSHLYGCRTHVFAASDWSGFIDAMLFYRNDPGSHITLSANEATLAGTIQQGEDFCYTLAASEAEIAVVMKLAALMHYPINDTTTEAAELDIAVVKPAQTNGVNDWLNLNAGRAEVGF